jgi:hypothetical protein
MATYKFKVGDLVAMARGPSVYAAAGPYEVVRLFPAVNDEPQYRIKGIQENHERLVKESELKRYVG